MAELWFYHLERASLEGVLPELLEKTLQRGWRALVKVDVPERLEALNSHLWTYRDDSFLPHGTAREAQAETQPVLLTLGDENANRAQVLFLTVPEDPPLSAERIGAYERVILIFNGHDQTALANARKQWSAAKASRVEASYWQQSPEGRWTKKA